MRSRTRWRTEFGSARWSATVTVEVVKRAEPRVDAAVVGDVEPPVGVRRGERRIEPDAVDAGPSEGAEMVDHALQVPDPVAVRVGERARVDLVEDAVAPPQPIAHRRTITASPAPS